MTNAKSAAPAEWQSLTVGATENIVIGSAETLLAWDPDAKTGTVRLLFNRTEGLVEGLPEHLQPGGTGGMPALERASLAAAKATLKELEAFYKHKHANLTTKRQGQYLRFNVGEDSWWVMTHEETAGNLIADGARPEGWTLPCGSDRVLLWNSAPNASTSAGTVYVRATDDEVVFADDQSRVGGTPATELGTWTFETVLVAMPATQAVMRIKGVKTKSAAAIAALAAKTSPRKIWHTQGDTISIATIARLRGTFRAESGGTTGDTPRWLRFARV